MARKLVPALAALMLCMTLARPAAAIVDGQPDNGAHPNVGLMIVEIDRVLYSVCSGTLIAEKVFLTAGHCTAIIWDYDVTAVYVAFDEVPTLSSTLYKGDAITNPGYTGSLPDTGDLGVILLKKPVRGIAPAALPPAGYLDSFATQRGVQEISVTAVGYGLQGFIPGQGGLADGPCCTRYVSYGRIANLTSALTDGFNVQITNAPGTGGGTCFGDSGGPFFADESGYLIAVNSFGLSPYCTGADFAYRTDTAAARAFLGQYVGLP